jgi:hypothetical protein
MTQFEQMLLDKGYIKHILNCKTMKFEIAKSHTISTMLNLDHRYFHNTDENALLKIANGKSVIEKDFTWNDRKWEICFGLHEKDKPCTLISPRPTIRVLKNNITLTEQNDDAMNIVLKEVDYEKIFKAMYDKSICFKFDFRDVAC